jgi:cellobiose PTS system EIIA component
VSATFRWCDDEGQTMGDDYEVAFELISTAGSSKSSSMLALQAARSGDADKAAALLAQAEADLLAAHRLQTELVQREAAGDQVPVNIILVHAQDHLTGAMLLKDLAAELIHVHAELRALRRPDGDR